MPSLQPVLRDAAGGGNAVPHAVALPGMEATPGQERRTQLHVVMAEPVVDRDVLGRELLACVAECPAGLPPARLIPALAERLGVHPDAIADRDIDVALGLLVVTGRLDEAGGLLVAVDEATRLTG